VVEIIRSRGGKVRERRVLCADCASGFERLTFGRNPDVGLVPLVVYVAERHAERAGASAKLGCPVCGLQASEIASNMIPGCPTCYTRFAKELESAISDVQGSAFHRGKTPAGFDGH